MLFSHEATYNRYENSQVSVTGQLKILNHLMRARLTLLPLQCGIYEGHQKVFCQVIYTYDNKYSLSLSGRADGSSSFGPQKRWDIFGFCRMDSDK